MRHLVPTLALLGLCAGCVMPPPPAPPAPPPPMISQLTATVAADDANCREYSTTGTVNGQQQPVVGRACRQADGTWRIDTGKGMTVAPAVSQVASHVAADNPSCRDYTAVATIDGRAQPIVGRSCELPDGSVQVTQGTPEQPAQVSITYPPTPYPYYAGYDPWFWGPPFVGASFVFVGHHHHHHDHGHFGSHHGGGHHS